MMRRCSRLGDGVPEFGPVLIYSGPVRSSFMTFRSDRFVELRQQMEWTMTSPLLVVTSFLGYGRVRVYNTQTLPSSTTIHDTQAQHLPVSRFKCGTGIGIQKVRLTLSIQIPGDPRLDRRYSVYPHLLSH